MYLDFYALKKAPFHTTPDPEFLFLSAGHKAALGALVYGIEERQGFVALVGEVGLGKTTILRSYLERVDQSQLKTIYIFNSNLVFSDLLKTICREFKLEVTTDDVFDTVTFVAVPADSCDDRLMSRIGDLDRVEQLNIQSGKFPPGLTTAGMSLGGGEIAWILVK